MPKEGGMKVHNSLWEEGQKMWMSDVGRDGSREGHVNGRGLYWPLERGHRLLLPKIGK